MQLRDKAVQEEPVLGTRRYMMNTDTGFRPPNTLIHISRKKLSLPTSRCSLSGHFRIESKESPWLWFSQIVISFGIKIWNLDADAEKLETPGHKARECLSIEATCFGLLKIALSKGPFCAFRMMR